MSRAKAKPSTKAERERERRTRKNEAVSADGVIKAENERRTAQAAAKARAQAAHARPAHKVSARFKLAWDAATAPRIPIDDSELAAEQVRAGLDRIEAWMKLVRKELARKNVTPEQARIVKGISARFLGVEVEDPRGHGISWLVIERLTLCAEAFFAYPALPDNVPDVRSAEENAAIVKRARAAQREAMVQAYESGLHFAREIAPSQLAPKLIEHKGAIVDALVDFKEGKRDRAIGSLRLALGLIGRKVHGSTDAGDHWKSFEDWQKRKRERSINM